MREQLGEFQTVLLFAASCLFVGVGAIFALVWKFQRTHTELSLLWQEYERVCVLSFREEGRGLERRQD